MTAIELAEWLEAMDIAYDTQAAAMLRKQAEAIKTLRDALQRTRKSLNSRLDDVYVMQALAATEELK